MLFDELERLRASEGLFHLLDHYAEQSTANPEGWLDRLMHTDGAEVHELVRWHGELIAFGWTEQNTGHAPPGCQRGVVAACYRVTPAGRRALREVQIGAPENAEDAASPVAVAERKTPFSQRKSRRPKQQMDVASS